ncbi:MAG: hypothetical protein AAGH90_11970 [Pseudomonadota bacterium]
MPQRFGWAVLYLLSGAVVDAQTATRKDLLPGLSDFTVADERASCANGRWDIVTSRVAEEWPHGASFLPKAAIHCPAVLVEIARRGRLRDLYANRTRQNGITGDSGAEHQRILSAALKDNTGYISTVGPTRKINCELAFDAGFYFGFYNPNTPVAGSVNEATIDALTSQCFSERNVAPKHAAIAGIRFGQRAASQF